MCCQLAAKRSITSIASRRLTVTKKMNKEIIIKGNYDLAAVSSMTAMSNVLKKHIVEQGLFTPILGKNYINVEGWQFAGGLMGMAAKITNIENLSSGTEKKWRADVEIIRLKDNLAVGFGTAICSNLEGKKKSFDEYAICSMAQTRAIGKAYRNMIGWVIKLAGYEATPSEEMMKAQDVAPAPKVAPVGKQGDKQPTEQDESALLDAQEALFETARDFGAKQGNEKQFIETKLKKGKIAWNKLTLKHYSMLRTEINGKLTK